MITTCDLMSVKSILAGTTRDHQQVLSLTRDTPTKLLTLVVWKTASPYCTSVAYRRRLAH